MKPIRNSAKAVIVKEGKLLLTKNKDDLGFFYLFPGGGQEIGEQLELTVKRECLEEIGKEIIVDDLIYVREYIGRNHEFAEWDSQVHQVEFYFKCTLVNAESDLHNGNNPDSDQVGVEWIDLEAIDQIRLYPGTLGKMIKNNLVNPCYVGDVN